MPNVRIPSPLRYYTNGQAEVSTTGRTVTEALDQLFAEYETLKTHLVDENGQLRRFVNLVVNDENVRDLDGLNTVLQEKDSLTIIPSIAGG